MSVHFNKGPAYGLSAEVNRKIAQKYDPQKDEDIRRWIEDVTGATLPDNLMESLKNGVILCKLINKLQPGSVTKISDSPQNWHQLENIGNFIKAITKYGVKLHDSFEANDLYENCNLTQVQTTLMALASMMGTNKFASQQGMTAYGTRRHLYDPKTGVEKPLDQTTISLQMGTNKGATQAGMTAPGTRRLIFDNKLGTEKCDSTIVSLQMGSNQGASQKGMTVYGLSRQVYDAKYCSTPNFPIDNGNQLASGSECSEGDYPAEYKYNQQTDPNRHKQMYQDFE
uniref:calponin-1 isoform X1 n=1 Tax=Pristiophorus japonicus TaxID=55135 RepID=UPI00398EA912